MQSDRSQYTRKTKGGDTSRTPPGNHQKKPRPPRKISQTYLHNAGLAYLQRFAASSAHFKTVMTRKIERSCRWHKDQDRQACQDILDEVTAAFERSGLLDDSAYARGLSQSLYRRGLSQRAIAAKLQIKGISDALITQNLHSLREEYGAETELKAALRLLEKRRMGPFARQGPAAHPATQTYAHNAAEKNNKTIQKAHGLLARNGFNYDTARQAVAMTRSEAEDFQK